MPNARPQPACKGLQLEAVTSRSLRSSLHTLEHCLHRSIVCAAPPPSVTAATSWWNLKPSSLHLSSHMCMAQRGSLTALGMKLSSSISSSFSSSIHCCARDRVSRLRQLHTYYLLLFGFCTGAVAWLKGLRSSSVFLGCRPTTHERKSPPTSEL